MVAICSEQTISSKLTNTDTPLTPVHPAAAWLVALGITGIMTTPRTFGQQNNPAVTACGAGGRERRQTSENVVSIICLSMSGKLCECLL